MFRLKSSKVVPLTRLRQNGTKVGKGMEIEDVSLEELTPQGFKTLEGLIKNSVSEPIRYFPLF